jgi:hypothetical protein
MTIAQIFAFGSWRCGALMATGAETLCKSAALVAEPFSGPRWKNGRFQIKAILEAAGTFALREGAELFDSAKPMPASQPRGATARE